MMSGMAGIRLISHAGVVCRCAMNGETNRRAGEERGRA
jgi:hypothetical protein